MKVPKGQVIYYRGKKLKAGEEIPAEIADRIEQKPEKPARSSKKSAPSETDKPTFKP